MKLRGLSVAFTLELELHLIQAFYFLVLPDVTVHLLPLPDKSHSLAPSSDYFFLAFSMHFLASVPLLYTIPCAWKIFILVKSLLILMGSVHVPLTANCYYSTDHMEAVSFCLPVEWAEPMSYLSLRCSGPCMELVQKVNSGNIGTGSKHKKCWVDE